MRTQTAIAALLLVLTTACGQEQLASNVGIRSMTDCANWDLQDVEVARSYTEMITGLPVRNFDLTCAPQGQWVGQSGRIGETAPSIRSITISMRKTIGDTALVHEMIHLALFDAYGDGDADHTFGEGPWTLDRQRQLLQIKLGMGACKNDSGYTDLDCMDVSSLEF